MNIKFASLAYHLRYKLFRLRDDMVFFSHSLGLCTCKSKLNVMDDGTAIDKHDGMARQLMTVMEEAWMVSTSVHIIGVSLILAR